MSNNLKTFIVFSVLTLSLISCEEEYIPDGKIYDKQFVVESYIEKSSANFPVYAIVTYSLPFYSSFGVDVVNNSFVRGAEVAVYAGNTKYQLQEVCLNSLPEPLRTELLKSLGFQADSVKTDICIYADVNKSIVPEEGIEYLIQVIKDQDTLTGRTLIPKLIPIDSIWFEKPAGKNQNDTFAQMFCIISDLPGQKDFYRYYTSGQGERLVANVNSVTDDVFFDGQKFKFTLFEARGPDEKFDDNSGLFRRGDTATIKWCTIPQTHYDFWNTLETSRTRQGPFASYVRIDGNINGGLGIFGGQNCIYYSIPIPK
jgi:hypothetical protein